MSATSEYIEEYKGYAMEQMKRYGIPASVTLAQGILESANGKSQLSKECNNHFGIKAGKSWLASGGQYRLFTDDKPNEKFCMYASVGDSYEHHSRILANSDRYKACFRLSPDDYVGWTNGLQRGGYATSKTYAKNLQSVIESQNLQQYDKQVMQEMKKEGQSFGVDSHPRQETASQSSEREGQRESAMGSEGKYSFPVKRSEFMLITSPFGNRTDPMDHSRTQFHKGIDIRTKHEAVLATEDGGRVTATNHNVNTGGGKSVTVEYDRADGSKYRCVYMHLDSIDVKVGDTVSAGQKLGISGNTGTRTTGEHLHFGVKKVNSDGTVRDMNPAAYLAEISIRGNLHIEAQHNGKDLIAQFKDDADLTPKEKETKDTQLSPEDWLKKLLGSDDSGVSESNDPIMEYAMKTFTSLMAIASQIDQGKSVDQKNQSITDALVTKTMDLSSLLPDVEKPKVQVTEAGKMVFSYNIGNKEYSSELTDAQSQKLSEALGSSTMTNEQKQQAVSGIVSGIIASQKASENYQQINSSSQQSQETLQRR